MSTTESNIKTQLIVSTSAPSSSTQPGVPQSLPLSTPTPLTATASVPLPSPPLTPFYDDKSTEKCYKKEKQILLEFDQQVKGREICSSFDYIVYRKKRERESTYASSLLLSSNINVCIGCCISTPIRDI